MRVCRSVRTSPCMEIRDRSSSSASLFPISYHIDPTSKRKNAKDVGFLPHVFLSHVVERVLELAVLDHLEVQVRAGRTAGGAGLGEQVAHLHRVPGLHVQLRVMPV